MHHVQIRGPKGRLDRGRDEGKSQGGEVGHRGDGTRWNEMGTVRGIDELGYSAKRGPLPWDQIEREKLSREE